MIDVPASFETNLPISPEKVSSVIALAREVEDLLPNAENDDERPRGEASDPEMVREHEYDAPYQELLGFLEALSDEELAALTAILWVGRGTYDADEFQTALEEAASLEARRAPSYLMSNDLLAEHLTEGLTSLGLEVEEV